MPDPEIWRNPTNYIPFGDFKVALAPLAMRFEFGLKCISSKSLENKYQEACHLRNCKSISLEVIIVVVSQVAIEIVCLRDVVHVMQENLKKNV